MGMRRGDRGAEAGTGEAIQISPDIGNSMRIWFVRGMIFGEHNGAPMMRTTQAISGFSYKSQG